MEARLLGIDMEYLEAYVEEEICISLSDACHKTRSQAGVLKKAMYGLVHAGLL